MPRKKSGRRRNGKRPTLSTVTVVTGVPVSATIGGTGNKSLTAANLLGDLSVDSTRRVVIRRVQVQTVPTSVSCTISAQLSNMAGMGATSTPFVTVNPVAVNMTTSRQFTIKTSNPMPVQVNDANPILVLNTISCQATATTQYCRVTTYFVMEPDATAAYVP